MEATLKKLWPRRKSIKRSEKPNTTEVPQVPQVPAPLGFEYNKRYEATVSGPPPKVGLVPMKPSEDKKPRKSFGHSKARSAVVQEFRTVVEKDVHSRAKSTGGIQPVLVGISRPVTSGSMHRDVMAAADGSSKEEAPVTLPAVIPPPPSSRLNTATSLPEPRKAQRFQSVTKRHVDIMSFAGTNSKAIEDYNEEVAKRNLDLKALASQSVTTMYVGGHSTDTTGNRTHHRSEMHSRNASVKSKTIAPPQETRQEYFIDSTDPDISGPKNGNFSKSRSSRDHATSRQSSIHGKVSRDVDESILQPSVSRSTTRANEGRLVAHGAPKEHPLPLASHPYNERNAEYIDTALGRHRVKEEDAFLGHTGQRPLKNTYDEVSRRTGASSSRASSFRSHRRDISNRMIMDLTADESEALGSSQIGSPTSDYSNSPVVAQAKTDMLQVRRAHIVRARNGNYTHLQDGEDEENTRAGFRAPGTSNYQSKRHSGAYSDAGSSFNEQSLAFSGVTTVSSMSPATKQTSSFESTLGTPKNPNAGEKTDPSTFYNDSPSVAEVANPQLVNQTPREIYNSPESLNSGDFVDPSRSFGVLTRDFAATPSRQPNRVQTSRHKQGSRSLGEQPTGQRRHLGFEHKSNSHSTNFTELPIINEPAPSPQLDHVDTPQKELTASSFDEVEFARKQAQARAALLRLQMSLEEQYDMSPGRPDSSTQRHVARQILDQVRKPTQDEKKVSAAPTSMYYEKKEYQSKAKTNRPAPIQTPSEENVKSSSGYTYEKQGPNTFSNYSQSVYAAVTVPHDSTKSVANSHIKSPSAGSASHSYNYSYANGTVNNSTFRNAAATLPKSPLTPVLPSPAGTEVSLSSFPMPTTAPQSPEHRGRKPIADPDRPRTARMHSTKSSIASVASVYSIPHHMVPARDSSRRDQFFADEDGGAW